MPTPEQGQIVAYFHSTTDSPDGAFQPGNILATKAAGVVDLQVFTRGTHDGPHYAQGVVLELDVPYSEENEPHTWRWFARDRPSDTSSDTSSDTP